MGVASRIQLASLSRARRAVLATLSAGGQPRTVPICFVVAESDDGRHIVHTPIDEKPKANDDPMALARVHDIVANARVSVLIDDWDEDWTRLGWLRIEGDARVVPARLDVVAALRAKYPQYAEHQLESRPMIEITIERVRSWGTLAGE